MELIEKINKLKGERAALVKESRAILDTADREKRDLTADENQKFDRIVADIEAKGKSADALESQLRIESDLSNQRDSNYRAGVNDGDAPKKGRASEAYKKAFFDRYARVGKNNLGAEHLNALQVGTDSEGGYLVPEEFETAIVRILQNGNPLRAAATVITTASDRNIPVETSTGAFAYIDEEAAYAGTDPVVGRVVLGAHKAGGIIKVSEELLQDAFFPIDSWLVDLAGRRFADLEDTNFGGGNGTGKPTGLFATTAVAGTSLTGTTGAVSATAVITGDNLIDTFHGLKRAYRDRASWVMGDGAAKMIRKLKDGDDQYMWQPGLVAGQPDRILGRPVIISDGATAPAVNARSIMFGDVSQYYIVDRLGMVMQRLNELYAANGQIGFKFMRRHDGKLVNAESFTFFRHGAAS
jgi:HK97 family phage major capsid protein